MCRFILSSTVNQSTCVPYILIRIAYCQTLIFAFMWKMVFLTFYLSHWIPSCTFKTYFYFSSSVETCVYTLSISEWFNFLLLTPFVTRKLDLFLVAIFHACLLCRNFNIPIWSHLLIFNFMIPGVCILFGKSLQSNLNCFLLICPPFRFLHVNLCPV